MPANRKPIYFALILLFIGLGCYVATAQVKARIDGPVCVPSKKQVINGVYWGPDQFPKFRGGEEKLMKFLQENINPNKADTSGRVIIAFVVGTDGLVSDIRILKSLSAATDKEAMRVVALSPKWIPGRDAGKPVKAQYTVPFLFKK